MEKRAFIFPIIYTCALVTLMFVMISDLEVAIWVNASIVAGTLFWLLRYRWSEKRRNKRHQQRENHKGRFDFRPASRHFDDIKR